MRNCHFVLCTKNFALPVFFVPFGTFFAHDSTLTKRRTRTTTKLLLGSLSIARGKKRENVLIQTPRTKLYSDSVHAVGCVSLELRAGQMSMLSNNAYDNAHLVLEFGGDIIHT